MKSANFRVLLVLLLFVLIALTTMASAMATPPTSAPSQALDAAMSPAPALVEVIPAPTSPQPPSKIPLGIERFARFSY